MSIVNSFKAYAQITRMAANAEERTSQLESLSGLVVRVSMKPVSTMQIGSGRSMVDGRFVWFRDSTLRRMYALPVASNYRDGEKK